MGLKWVEVNGKRFQLYNKLIDILELMKERRRKKWDNILLITGMEGSGKTTGLAFPIAYYLANGNIKVVFTPEQFQKTYIDVSPDEEVAIIWDEFVFGGSSTDTLSKMQKTMTKLFTTGRKKLCYILLVMPNIFYMNSYFACHRSLGLLHLDSSDLINRDYYYYFPYTTKNLMFNKYRRTKYMDLNLAKKFGFIGELPVAKQFPNNQEGNITFYPENLFYPDDIYNKMKDEAIASIGGDNVEEGLFKWFNLVKSLRDSGKTWKELGELHQMPKSTVEYQYKALESRIFKEKVQTTAQLKDIPEGEGGKN